MEKFAGSIAIGSASLPVGSPKGRWHRERHQWFDPWKVAKGDNLKTLVETIAASVRRHEKDTDARSRARRKADERHHVRRIEAIVCNLAHAVLLPPPTGRIATNLGKNTNRRSRYDSPLLGKCFSPLIWMLDGLGCLELRLIPVPRGEVSSIAPTPLIASKVLEFGVQLSEFGRDDTEEVVL